MADTNSQNQNGEPHRFRLFLAAPVDAGLAQPLMDSLRASQPDMPPMRLTPWDNLHLTLAFLGEHSSNGLNEFLMPRVNEVLAEALPGRIHFRQVVGFPSAKQPKYLALEGYGSPTALALREQLLSSLTDLLPDGREKDRQWRPHVTLARLLDSADSGIEGTPWQAELPLRQVVLYRSQRGLHGSVYTPLSQWDLTGTGD